MKKRRLVRISESEILSHPLGMVSVEARLRIAYLILFGSVIGWPISALWLAKDEPTFILALSWMAITITAWDVLTTADVRSEQDGGKR